MAEESAAPSTSADKTESMDVDAEAKKYLGLGQKNLVMGDIPAAVNAFQEAASLLANKYGETGNECAEAYFFYGKSLLELARMENGVLGNALEGVQVEEEEEKTEDSMVESADNIDEEAREELREQVYNAMGEKDESRKNPEESLVHTGVEMQPKDVEMEEVEEEVAAKEEKEKAALGGEDITVVEKKEEQEKAEKQVEATTEEQNINEVTTEVALEDGAAREEKPVDAEGTAGEDKRVVVEEAREDAAVHRVVVSEDAAVKVNPVIEEAAEAAGGDTTLEKEVAAGEAPGKEKVVEIAAQERREEEVEKQADAIVEKNPIVEELVKASGELEREFMTAVEKVEGQAEKEPPAKATAEKTEDMKPATEQVVVNLKEKEETLDSREGEPSAPNETTPSGSIKQSHEIQPEEKAEVAPKVEKEEEKDDEMGEGEEMEGSEEEDKVEEDKENDSAVEEDKENDSAVEEDKENDSAVEEDKENDSTVEEKESEEDDVGNLELAWDMLELAKVIYKRQDTKEAQLLVAQAHLKLGEVSIESENYSQAIEEFRSCLALQQKYLEAHDRLLAETHYHLGLAFHYDNQYDEAVLQYSKSMEVIDKRMAMLTERLKTKGEGSAEDEKEIVELEGLLPEIKEKIEDSKESQKSARIAELALKATLVGGSSSSFPQATESNPASAIPAGQKTDGAPQCITDISHLVRKKRKPEEETQQGDNEAKKSKPEPAVNGGGDATPSGNVVAEKKEEEAEERPQVETVQSAV